MTNASENELIGNINFTIARHGFKLIDSDGKNRFKIFDNTKARAFASNDLEGCIQFLVDRGVLDLDLLEKL